MQQILKATSTFHIDEKLNFAHRRSGQWKAFKVKGHLGLRYNRQQLMVF